MAFVASAGMFAVRGEEPLVFDRGAIAVINEENDFFVNTDRHYTQGIKVAYLHEDGHMPLGMHRVADWLPNWAFEPSTGRSGYFVGQNMYTPADLAVRERLFRDRPYAGWLYAGLLLHRHGVTPRSRRPMQESWELELGTIGSPSLARQAQTWVHEIRGFAVPQGWMNQLHSEPGFRLKYERSWRLDLAGRDGVGPGVDAIPWVGGAAGTVEDSARVGGVVRVGLNLPRDFGVRIIDSLSTTDGGLSRSRPAYWGGHVFAGFEGRGIARNAFLDGNLTGYSQSIKRIPFVGDAMVGFNLELHHVEVGYIHVFRMPEFEGQTEHNEFGCVYLKFRF